MTDCDACGDHIPDADGEGGIPEKIERNGEEFRFCRDCHGYKTLRVPTADWVIAQRQRQDEGRQWGEQIVRPEGGGTPDKTLRVEDPNPSDADLDRLRELIEQVPERTADEIEGRLR